MIQLLLQDAYPEAGVARRRHQLAPASWPMT